MLMADPVDKVVNLTPNDVGGLRICHGTWLTVMPGPKKLDIMHHALAIRTTRANFRIEVTAPYLRSELEAPNAQPPGYLCPVET